MAPAKRMHVCLLSNATRRLILVAVAVGLGTMYFSTAFAQSTLFKTEISPTQQLVTFNKWASIAQGRKISPVWALKQPYDLPEEWVGADGEEVKLLVRQPARLDEFGAVDIGPVPEKEDARLHFEKAIAQARKQKASTIRLKGGTYNFYSTESRFGSHLLLEYMKDFRIEGNGATLVFHTNAPGLLIQQSQRLKIENLTLKFSVHSSSFGKIVLLGRQKVLRIDDQFPVTGRDKIAQVVEVIPESMRFIPDGARVVFPPEADPPVFIGEQTFSAKLFEKIKEGTRLLVLHHWYSAQAIKIDGYRNQHQTEDISISGVTIHSTPGMALTVTGLKRGLAVIQSRFLRDEHDPLNVAGPSWDALNVHLAGGDVLVTGNRFSHSIDDAINLGNPIHPIKQTIPSGRKILLSISSRFIQQGDKLAFFDDKGLFFGEATVVAPTADRGKGIYEVTLDTWPANLTENSFVRDVDLISSRFLIKNNQFEDISGHGILAQIPNGLISENVFARLNRNAVRLLSNIGMWNEGVGAFNIAVRNNKVIDGGTDHGMEMPWSSISVYGGVKDGLSQYLFNENIEISGNNFDGLKQGCIAVLNSRKVRIRNNICRYETTTRTQQDVITSNSLDITSE